MIYGRPDRWWNEKVRERTGRQKFLNVFNYRAKTASQQPTRYLNLSLSWKQVKKNKVLEMKEVQEKEGDGGNRT